MMTQGNNCLLILVTKENRSIKFMVAAALATDQVATVRCLRDS
jgi:hypothetical protein